MVFISDGDGSSNHRVVALNVSEALDDASLHKPAWVMGNNNTQGAGGVKELGHDITSAHSIAYHSRSNTLLLADRENNRTLHISASTGAVIANWSCPELQLGKKGTVFGVRTSESLDLVFLAVADQNQANVKAGKPNQFVYVLDGTSITKQGPGQCKVVQTIAIDPKTCMTPHLMGHNERNHDLYVACVGKPTAVLRFVREHEYGAFATSQLHPHLLIITAMRGPSPQAHIALCVYADQIISYVTFVTVAIVIVAIVVGFTWWCASSLFYAFACSQLIFRSCMLVCARALCFWSLTLARIPAGLSPSASS